MFLKTNAVTNKKKRYFLQYFETVFVAWYPRHIFSFVWKKDRYFESTVYIGVWFAMIAVSWKILTLNEFLHKMYHTSHWKMTHFFAFIKLWMKGNGLYFLHSERLILGAVFLWYISYILLVLYSFLCIHVKLLFSFSLLVKYLTSS